MSEFDLTIHGYKFQRTCFACPEQYDVFDQSGKQVAYCRLRHGRFTVECPDAGGECVYMAKPNGDGIFEDDEQLMYLTNAAVEIQNWITKEKFKQAE